MSGGRRSSRREETGRIRVAADGDSDQNLAAAGEGTDVLAGVERLVVAVEGVGATRAQRQRPADQIELRRRLARPQPTPQPPSPPVSGCPGRRARGRGSRRPGRCPAHPALSTSATSSPARSARALADRLDVRGDSLVLEQREREHPRTRSHSSSWSIQLVCTFASRSAFSRYRSSRSGVSGHAPTTVWRIRYASLGSRQPARRSRIRASHAAGSLEMAASRARTSPLRLVSCVVVASNPPGERARLAAWKSETERENRPGSPPTSFNATKRFQR